MSGTIQNILDEKIGYRKYLYPKGFLITNDDQIDITKNEYPFYQYWTKKEIGNYSFLVHNRNKLFTYQNQGGGVTLFLIGHAYNPFSMVVDENEILFEMATSFSEGRYLEKLNELTGIFITGYIDGENLVFSGDATCTQTSYYGTYNGRMYISSHTMLFEDCLGIKKTEYIERLIHYKHYQLFGIMLPGDLSPYKEFTRTIPNFQVAYSNGCFDVKRFWPTSAIATDDGIYEAQIAAASDILSKNLKLIAKKYPNKRAAISMTGGCDSKTTIACTNGEYDSFQYFSFASTEAEKVDLEAAKKIAKIIGVEHKAYLISENNSDFPDYEIIKTIIEQNTGNIGRKHSNDYRKRAFFVEHHDFDVEVKSWASEIVRAYYNKRFAIDAFSPKVTPRKLSTMYKVFTYQRKLLCETDKVFERYLKKYYSDEIFKYVEWTDIIFWEYRYSGWNGLSTSHEHIFSYDITIPYNNRRLLEILLNTPLNYRIADKCHKDIQAQTNKEIADSDVSVVNIKHTHNRALIERLYFKANTFVPF